jgi:hypothetical protein
MKQFYTVMGEFNSVGICEAPDDVVIARYDRPKGAQINRPHCRGRGRDCRLPKACAAGAQRLPLRSAADDPTSDALIAVSLPAASWNLAAATG